MRASAIIGSWLPGSAALNASTNIAGGLSICWCAVSGLIPDNRRQRCPYVSFVRKFMTCAPGLIFAPQLIVEAAC
jgi:hypothetical protein